MGNLCGGGDSPSNELRLKAVFEEEQKRNFEEHLKNMANGGHQMLANFTPKYQFKQSQNENYYKFNWGIQGQVSVSSFGVKIVSQNETVEFVEGLANYSTFVINWRPWNSENETEKGYTFICLDSYRSVDASTGDQQSVPTCAKKFLIDSSGRFVRVLNSDELVNEAIEVAVESASESKTIQEKNQLKSLLIQQREAMINGVIDEIALNWRCWVEIWTHEVIDENKESLIYNQKCTKRKRILESPIEENKIQLNKFYDDLFSGMNRNKENISSDIYYTSSSSSSLTYRPQVTVNRAKQMQVYNGLFLTDSVRCHQCEYRKYTESVLTIAGHSSYRSEFEGKRWVFGWSDVPELSSREYMVSLFNEYASVGGAFHEALLANLPESKNKTYNKNDNNYNHQERNSETNSIFDLLVNHPFNTEPNNEVVAADKTKQRIAGLMQMACGSHAMFSGLSPPIDYPRLKNKSSDNNDYFKFSWPSEGKVKVCALGFTIKLTDEEVQFTQGLGTFIMFDVRWKKCENPALYKKAVSVESFYNSENGNDEITKAELNEDDLIDSIEVFLENNLLINAQSGIEEPLSEPVKHILISRSGDLLCVLNISELVDYAVDTAIQQKGNISAEEKQAYKEMLEKTQLKTLTKAVKCDLSYIWCSWVQLWTYHQITNATKQIANSSEANNTDITNPLIEINKFSPPITCIQAQYVNQSSETLNKKNFYQLINSVLGNNNNSNEHISVDLAQQTEYYSTLFEKSTLRPFIAKYSKITSTKLSFLEKTIVQKELKNSQHVFIWDDKNLPELSTKQYIQSVYQDYLDQANAMYSELKVHPDAQFPIT